MAAKTKAKRTARKRDILSETFQMQEDFIRQQWPALYVAKNLHRLGMGTSQTMDFSKYPAQVAFLKDDSKKIIIMKCVQVGITECLIIKCFTKAIENGWSIIYCWPTAGLRDDIVKKRINLSIACTPYYRQALKEAPAESDHIGMKILRNGVARFVASESKVAFIGDPADMIIIDEVDKCDQVNLAMAPDRLAASDHKYDWRVGNPSFPKFGIHALYLKSDQKQWHIPCPSCGEWQPLDFFKNVIKQEGENDYRLLDTEWTPKTDRDINLYCAKCGSQIDRFSEGEWMPTNPGAETSGYLFTQLFSPTVKIREIWEDFQDGQTDPNKLQLVYNSRLGLPYSAEGQSLTSAILDNKCVQDYLMPSTAKGCTMGVDVGSKINYRISDYPAPNTRRAVAIGTVSSWEELDYFVKAYDVKCCVVDIRPEQRDAEKFRARFPHIVWLCYYPESDPLTTFELDEDRHLVKANRTVSIDGMVAGFLEGRNQLPKNYKSLDGGDYIKQIEAPKRRKITVFTKEGKPKGYRYVWDEDGKPDHYFHAENYDNLAMQVRVRGGRAGVIW